jgi:hypothetical protein
MGFSDIKYSLASILLFTIEPRYVGVRSLIPYYFYHRDEVQVPYVHLMYGILVHVGYGPKLSTTLDTDVSRKIPHVRRALARRAGGPSLTCA